MKRLFVVPSLMVALMVNATGCPDNECCGRTGYCDDSGCYACDDTGYCWPVPNDPCSAAGTACAADEVCTEYGCAKVCSFDTDCAAGEQCLATGYCGPALVEGDPCTTDDNCVHGYICEGGVCISGCQSDEDCSTFGTGWVCTSCGRCAPPEQPTCGEWKTFCSTAEECGAGRTCTDLARCAYTCDPLSPQCPLGQICDPAITTCVEDPSPTDPQCIYSADCAELPACTAAGCLCVNSYCHPLCTATAECGWGEVCDMGLCVPNYRPGE
jgi:hypothetical protein